MRIVLFDHKGLTNRVWLGWVYDLHSALWRTASYRADIHCVLLMAAAETEGRLPMKQQEAKRMKRKIKTIASIGISRI